MITTYKRPRLLKRAVTSVLNQTYPHFKVCVYDNASNDETEEIMQEFMRNDSRVTYHKHPENIGMMANYAFAFSRIDTPYFSFLPDDDYLLPWFYETALENFKKHPDAAFSSCGILAIDHEGVVVADPLSGWKREGYYSVAEGIYEMISSKYKFPPPTGVLFQSQIVKNVLPLWSKEIQVMWDPDYLIQIAARFPFVISRKISSIFLAHEGAFSTGFYKKILQSPSILEDYFIATVKLIDRVLESPDISKEVKTKIKRIYVKLLNDEVSNYMKYFICVERYPETYLSAKILFKHFGIEWKVLKLLLQAFTKHKFPRISSKVAKCHALLKAFRFYPKTEIVNPTQNWRSF